MTVGGVEIPCIHRYCSQIMWKWLVVNFINIMCMHKFRIGYYSHLYTELPKKAVHIFKKNISRIIVQRIDGLVDRSIFVQIFTLLVYVCYNMSKRKCSQLVVINDFNLLHCEENIKERIYFKNNRIISCYNKNLIVSFLMI